MRGGRQGLPPRRILFEGEGEDSQCYTYTNLDLDLDPACLANLVNVVAVAVIVFFGQYSDVGYNLACILTFPCHQRKGYGRFLIAFSYLLSKKEEKVGSPEKPMSDLGQQAYKPYWISTIVDYLQKNKKRSHVSIMDISKETSIMAEDIIFSLNQVGILKFIDGTYFISAEDEIIDHLCKKHPIKKPFIVPEALHWTPYLTDVKRDKFSIHNKRPTYGGGEGTALEVTGELGTGGGGGSGAMGR